MLLENHERNQTKLDPKFKGPYKVVELLDGDSGTCGLLSIELFSLCGND